MNQDKRIDVLMVDDDVLLANTLAEIFIQGGLHVTAKLNVDDAMDSLRTGFKPDIIVFDIKMPKKDGFTFLEELKNENLGVGSIKIALTNDDNQQECDRATSLGASGYIVKSTMSPAEILEHIRKIVAHKKVVQG